MKVFVLSQPKAGTYLCVNILKEFGFQFDGYHFGEKKYERYPDATHPNFKNIIFNPKLVETRSKLKESIKLIKDGHIGVGHLTFSHQTELVLSDFKKIILTRPDKEILDSLKRWESYSGRKPTNIAPTMARIRGVEQWPQRDDIFHMTFADMKNSNIMKIDQLQDFLKIDPKLDSKKVCSDALKNPSKTKIIV